MQLVTERRAELDRLEVTRRTEQHTTARCDTLCKLYVLQCLSAAQAAPGGPVRLASGEDAGPEGRPANTTTKGPPESCVPPLVLLARVVYHYSLHPPAVYPASPRAHTAKDSLDTTTHIS